MPKLRRLTEAFQRWAIRHLPASLVARPGEWLIAVLCGTSGLAVITRTSHSLALENVLRDWGYYLWAGCLMAGCLFMVCGLTSIRWLQAPIRYELTRPACYKFGLRLLGLGSFTYGLALLINSGWNALFPACLAVIFAGFCTIRLLTVAVRL
jgi:hypothetical protein